VAGASATTATFKVVATRAGIADDDSNRSQLALACALDRQVSSTYLTVIGSESLHLQPQNRLGFWYGLLVDYERTPVLLCDC
jgi:hypothetical protein